MIIFRAVKKPLARRSSQKFLRIVENVAQSKYFKSVAQSKYIKKAVAGISKTKLKLSVDIKGCVGTLAINIPPPPSDRLWFVYLVGMYSIIYGLLNETKLISGTASGLCLMCGSRRILKSGRSQSRLTT